MKTEEINEIIQVNQQYQKKIKEQLDIMNEDIKENEKSFKDEPETRVMKTVHRTLA